jgi:hypothetical protein
MCVCVFVCACVWTQSVMHKWNINVNIPICNTAIYLSSDPILFYLCDLCVYPSIIILWLIWDLHYGNHIINNPLKSFHIFAIYQFPSIKHIGWYLLSIRNYQSWSVNHYPFIIHQPIITHLSITAIYPPLSIYHYHRSWIHGLSINQSINH